jgi:hypothetical protein
MIFITISIVSIIIGGLCRALLLDCPAGLKAKVGVLREIGLLVVLTILLPDLARGHGNRTMDQDSCLRQVGGSLIHFNAYQPHNEARAQYCTEIPGEGDTFLVVDLVDPSLRHLPVGVRVVRGVNEAAVEETVAYWPPVIHPDGVVRGEAKLVKGIYKLIIMPEGSIPSSYLLRVQQINYSAMARNNIVPIVIILLFVLIGYEFSKVRTSIK